MFIDLLVPQIVLWGHLEARVYDHKPRILDELSEGGNSSENHPY